MTYQNISNNLIITISVCSVSAWIWGRVGLRVSGREGQRLGNNIMKGDEQASNGELEVRDR